MCATNIWSLWHIQNTDAEVTSLSGTHTSVASIAMSTSPVICISFVWRLFVLLLFFYIFLTNFTPYLITFSGWCFIFRGYINSFTVTHNMAGCFTYQTFFSGSCLHQYFCTLHLGFHFKFWFTLRHSGFLPQRLFVSCVFSGYIFPNFYFDSLFTRIFFFIFAKIICLSQ